MTTVEPRTEQPPEVPAKPAKATRSERASHERRLGLSLSAPAFIVMILVTAYPLGYAVVLSLYQYRLTDPGGREFVGLGNYVTVLTDPIWWNDFVTTTVITVASVVVELVLGFCFAWVMYRIIQGRSVVRTAILVPYGIITVVSAYIWRYAFQLDSGFVNQWFGLEDYNWFGGRWSSLFVIVFSEIWKTTPFISLLLLAGLVQVPMELQEAASVDGATAWQRLWKVTLPNMKAAIMVALLFRTLDALAHLRQPLRDDERRQQHRDAVVPRLPAERDPREPRGGLGDLGAALHHGRHHRPHLHQGLPNRSLPSARRCLMATTRKTSNWWTVWGVLILLWAVFPLVWMVSLSFKDPDTFRSATPSFFPEDWSWDNYDSVFSDSLFTSALRNSFGISILATSLSVVVAMFAAYAIARLEFPLKKVLLSMALAIAMFPQAALVGPLFDMWRRLGIYDTWIGLIIPYLTFALPLSIWTMSAFFRQIPWEMEQAAQVDGATAWQAFRKVIVPLAAPGVFTTAILTFFFCWNEFLLAASLTSTDRARTVPAALTFFTGQSQFQSPITSIMAASVVVTIPVVIIVLLFQRRIVAGLTAGAVKG